MYTKGMNIPEVALDTKRTRQKQVNWAQNIQFQYRTLSNQELWVQSGSIGTSKTTNLHMDRGKKVSKSHKQILPYKQTKIYLWRFFTRFIGILSDFPAQNIMNSGILRNKHYQANNFSCTNGPLGPLKHNCE